MSRTYVAEFIIQSGKNIVYEQIKDIAKFSSISRLREIKIPTLIIVGLLDQVIDSLSSIFLDINISNSQIIESPAADHTPFLTFKNQFNNNLLHFIQEQNSCQICEVLAKWELNFPSIEGKFNNLLIPLTFTLIFMESNN